MNTGTYYLINGAIIYTLDSELETALDHVDLWPKVVHRVLSPLGFEDRQDLIRNALYGADRGRVVFENGVYHLYGTPGSKPFRDELLGIFGMDLVDKPIAVDFHKDLHYRVVVQDKDALYFMLRLHKIKLQTGGIRLPGLKRMTRLF
jgi:hypothetical protein